MIKAFRVMLLPNNKQQTKFFQFAGAARFAYNWALDKNKKNFSDGNKFQNDCELRREFTQYKHSGEKPWLNTVSNNVLKQAIKDCVEAYRKFFAKQKRKGYVKFSKKKLAHFTQIGKTPTVYDMNGHPKFKSRKNGDFSFYQDTGKIKFSATHVKFEAITDSRRKNRQKLNWIKLAEPNRIPLNTKYLNPRISFDGEHWWLSVAVEVEDIPAVGVYGDGIGIDLGVRNLAVISDGSIVKNINRTKTVRKLKKKRRRLQRQVSRQYRMNKDGDCFKKTKNIIKNERKLLKIFHRLANIRRNHIHQATTAIIQRKSSYICLEDLNVRGMMANRHMAEQVQEQGFFEFRRQIEYKSEQLKIPVIIADRFYPSSKTCSQCGEIKKDLKTNETFKCSHCGNVIDRDYQAAINLKRYAEKQLMKAIA